MSVTCPNCGYQIEAVVPAEPPVGTWVKDRFGATHVRQAKGWGSPGTVPFGKWDAMWQARGPLVECGPWGQDPA